jgi:polyisoprenoid-binding protein YceI
MNRKINFIIITLLISSYSFSQNFTLDTSISSLKWIGKELSTKEHYGALIFKSGNLILKNDQPVKGKFVVDMTSLKNLDLPKDYRVKLEGHLKSNDFFSVNKFPEAYLEMESSTKKGENNFEIKGALTIKGIKFPITFDMLNKNGNWEANLVFDRSKYNVRFRSGSFFENLGDKLIYDDIEIETKLVFN